MIFNVAFGRLLRIFLSLSVFSFSQSTAVEDGIESSPTADVPTGGKFLGYYMTSRSGRKFAAFSGIPYAKPPLGPLRFKGPLPAEPMDIGVYEAKEEGDDCLQEDLFNWNKYQIEETGARLYVGNEDCLYLNVYTPQVNPEAQYPVIVYFHGGGFMIGSGSKEVIGPEIIMDRDVIFVTVNYRLGVFGFLCLENSVGCNLGLRDQRTALSWIKEYIKIFGGDSSRVTIMGESAGGGSVHLHMLSPMSRGLFVRGISESGTAEAVWATYDLNTATSVGARLAQSLECQKSNSHQTLLCLQEIPATRILEKSVKMKAWLLDMIFRPVVEDEGDTSFITMSSMQRGSDLPWINGVTSGEGLFLTSELIKGNPKEMSKLKNRLKTLLPVMLGYSQSANKENLTESIMHQYLGDKQFGLESFKEATKMFSDSWFFESFLRSNYHHKGPLYLFYFDFIGSKSFKNDSSHDQMTELGVSHGDNMHYMLVIRKLSFGIEMNEQEASVSNALLDLYTNFASSGNPTSENITWPNAKNSNEYLEVSRDGQLRIKENILGGQNDFWENFRSNLNIVKDEL